MLLLHIHSFELFDNNTNEFITIPETDIYLEHSLSSISKWESIWKKPYLTDTPHTIEESMSYVTCMCLNKVDPQIIRFLPDTYKKQINDYINDSATATWFSKTEEKKSKKEVITSELIYYWMIEMGIPFKCDKWNINRLLTLIKICGLKAAKEKKMSKKDIYRQNQALNAQRRAKNRSKG